MAGIVRDCLAGLHVLPHRLTGKHYRDFLLHDLPELLEGVPLAVSTNVVHVCILVVLWEMFSVTRIMIDG
jgi:hypothetical protein